MRTKEDWIKWAKETADKEQREWEDEDIRYTVLAEKCEELDKQLQEAQQLLETIKRDCRKCNITYFGKKAR